jgi:phage replication initiation protein
VAADGATGQVPSANRGLKSFKTLVPSLAQALEVAHIDFLTFTFDAGRLVPDASTATIEAVRRELLKESGRAEEGARSRLAWLVFDLLLSDEAPGLTLENELRGFRNFYDHHRRILSPAGEVCGFVALGGERQKSTVCVELTGTGCAHVVAWDRLRAKLAEVSVKLSRVDVAHDDFEGQFGLSDALRWYSEGLFTSRGRPPAVQEMGWNDESGRTLYIGKNVGNQQLCIYEKGKQQGDTESKWIRWEGRFGSKYREIPLDILTDPAAYLVGHFPALAWISEKSTRMDTAKKRAETTLVGALSHCRRQYGALLNLLKTSSPDHGDFWRLVNGLVRDRLPPWAFAVPAASEAFQDAIQAVLIRGQTDKGKLT